MPPPSPPSPPSPPPLLNLCQEAEAERPRLVKQHSLAALRFSAAFTVDRASERERRWAAGGAGRLRLRQSLFPLLSIRRPLLVLSASFPSPSVVTIYRLRGRRQVCPPARAPAYFADRPPAPGTTFLIGARPEKLLSLERNLKTQENQLSILRDSINDDFVTVVGAPALGGGGGGDGGGGRRRAMQGLTDGCMDEKTTIVQYTSDWITK